jgi:phospholipase C
MRAPRLTCVSVLLAVATAAAGLGTASAAGLGTASAAAGPVTASASTVSTPIRHVVVIDLENHSFDEVLGFWCDQTGRCPAGGMPATVRLSNGAVVKPKVSPDIIPIVDHSLTAQPTAINGGKMNGWEKLSGCSAATGYACVSGYQSSQIPNITSLANHFAISDKTFSMADSPSWGGHLYVAMASLDGFRGGNPGTPKGAAKGPGWGCNSGKVTPWGPKAQQVPSCVPDYSLSKTKHPYGGAFEPTPVPYHATIFDEIQAAGLSWKIYGAATGNNVWAICPSLAECEYTKQHKNLVDASQFMPDAASQTNFPAFSVVTAGGAHDPARGGSCHNGSSMTACDNYIGDMIKAVEKGPNWKSTAIFITFDDCGCFYDQVPPGVNPDGTLQGPRLPLLIVSPYARPGFTDNTTATMAGILAYTEHAFGLAALGSNDAAAYAYGKAFNYAQAPLPPAAMVRRPLPRGSRHIDNAAILRQET